MIDIFQIVRLNQIDLYQLNIDKNDIDIVDWEYKNLLQQAIARHNNEIALDLVHRGINLNYKGPQGKTALHMTADFNNFEVAQAIVKAGGEINVIDDYGNSPLLVAVFNAKGKNYDLVKYFMSNGANPYTKNNSNKSSLDFAIQIKDNKLVDMLSNR